MEENIIKICRICKEKPSSKSHIKNGVQKYASYCSSCAWKKRTANNGGKNLYYGNRESRLIKKYNITEQMYNDMLIKQHNCCMICKADQKSLSKPLVVDHCHTTGKVRGLLCNNCNLALGLFKDNQSILLEAIQYLAF